MSATRSCSDISEEEIIRKSITYLQSLSAGNEPTLKQAVSDVAEKLKCESGKKGSKSYEKIKEALKKTMAVFFRHGPDSSQWTEFKAKHKKREKEAKKPARTSREKESKRAAKTSRDIESLKDSQLTSLAKMCQADKPKTEIQEKLKDAGVSKIQGQTLSKIKKDELCETIEAIAPSKTSLPAAQASRPEIQPEKCDTRAYTIQQLKEYIASKGWTPAPSKATKAKICAYIESMEGKTQVQPPLAPPQATVLAGPSVQVPGATAEVPDGYDDCANPRGTLTKPKIRQWIMEKGWHLEPDFPGFPPDKKDKGTWCAFLAGLITAHPLVPSRKLVSPPVPSAGRAVTTCLQTTDWKTVEEVEKELDNCPPGKACDISTRECVSEKDLVEEERPSMLLPLKNGKTVQIYAKKKEHLQKLRPALQKFIGKGKPEVSVPSAQSCATLSSGSRQDLLEDLSCPVKQSCNLDVSQCRKEQAGQIQLSLGGKAVTGSAEKIDELQKTLEKSVPAAQPVSAKPKPKVMFKPGHIVYGEEEQKRQAESSAWLSQLIGESKEVEVPEQVPKEIVRPKSRAEPKPIPAPIPQREIPIPVTEQPSEVARLVKRLRDIRAEAIEPPVRLRIAESQLSKAIGTCVGIPS